MKMEFILSLKMLVSFFNDTDPTRTSFTLASEAFLRETCEEIPDQALFRFTRQCYTCVHVRLHDGGRTCFRQWHGVFTDASDFFDWSDDLIGPDNSTVLLSRPGLIRAVGDWNRTEILFRLGSPTTRALLPSSVASPRAQ
ncbi:MAG: hypothetical protein [Circular genetic element sp.]|nr:MAG: hypothetical protein [Circular genetic element sp.]